MLVDVIEDLIVRAVKELQNTRLLFVFFPSSIAGTSPEAAAMSRF